MCITLQVLTIQKFLVLVFDSEIGRLCAFKREVGGSETHKRNVIQSVL